MGGHTNYSYETSLPPHREDPVGKKAQKERILQGIKDLGGSACLKQVQEFMNIPQSSCSGRINDLIADGTVKHQGFIIYAGRLRKKFIVITETETSLTLLFE